MNKIVSLLKTKEVRSKIFYSFVILILFRILAAIPVIGIPADALKNLFAGDSFGDLLSTVSGGVLETASVIAIGLAPYINASVMLQLLTPVIPRLEELRNEGSQGRRTISIYTRLLTIPLAILQSFVIYSTLRGFNLMDALDPLQLAALIATLTAGGILMMYFGELVSEGGIGGGTSLIIFLGILATVPASMKTNFSTMDWPQRGLVIAIYAVLIAVAIFISESERRLKLQYSAKGRVSNAVDNYLPVKLTQFGVMPVIFAISLFSFPQIVARFLISREISDRVTDASQWVITNLSNPYVRNIGEFVLIVLFSFFYVTIVFNTKEIAENLQKQGAFILGIRPGKATEEYLRAVSFRLTALGSIVLASLAVLPSLLVSAGIIQSSPISGTGFLIVVGVVLEVKRQLESMVVVRNYEKYA